MSVKIVEKILNYLSQQEIVDFALHQIKDRVKISTIDGQQYKEISLPLKLKSNLADSFRTLLALNTKDLITNTYFKHNGESFKISITPHNNERIIISRLKKSSHNFSLSRLGLRRQENKALSNFIARKSGLLIISSPNNEGKSITISALVKELNAEKLSIYTLLKHPEFDFDGVNLMVGDNKKRERQLERILKHDSDVIIIDDVSEALLEKSALAAQSGRLVIIGLKTDSVNELLTKLGVIKNQELPIMTVFQKLLAKTCPHCLKKYINDELLEIINNHWPKNKKYQPQHFFKNQGCYRCHHSGQQGKIAVFNIIKSQSGKTESLADINHDILEKAANGLISLAKLIKK